MVKTRCVQALVQKIDRTNIVSVPLRSKRAFAGIAKAVISFCLFTLVPFLEMQAQSFALKDDMVITGPYQRVRVNVASNDTIPCKNYKMELISPPALPVGLATVVAGGFIDFRPDVGSIPANSSDTAVVLITYSISCGTAVRTATLTVKVSRYNNPANIVPNNLICYEPMPNSITFDIQRKYTTAANLANTPTPGNKNNDPAVDAGYLIDGMTSPLVGDLNGDGKPEIVMVGVTGGMTSGAAQIIHYINIYNGQTGERLYRHTLPSADLMGDLYHRSPSQIALADVDEDGIGEIIVATHPLGRVRCYKPIFSGTTVTGMSKMWEATEYAAPITSSYLTYGYPHPYIADLNGDGIPEVIVYNKIYNAQTGNLLMSWQGAGVNKASSTGTGGLSNTKYSNPSSETSAAAIRDKAMTGRRPGSGLHAEAYLAVPAIVDIDGDGHQEIITGNRIHKFNFKYLGEAGDTSSHLKNTYTTIEGPQSVTLPTGTSTSVTFGLSDGFTRVADIDGDGRLDIITVSYSNEGSLHVSILIYVWDWDPLTGAKTLKAASTFYSDGQHGNFAIPFVGDINGKLDGWDGVARTRKLPEICILGGSMHIDRSINNNGRSGLKFHPLSSEKLRRGVGWDNNNVSATNRRFNLAPLLGVGSDGSFGGHILGLNYDAQENNIADRLKIIWALEHADHSDNTGITLFDFDNNGTADLCYRDESTLRVISPAKGDDGSGTGSDYVELSETATTPNTSIMFSTPVYSGTGFEYPAIADVNMDGSADIIVTQNHHHWNLAASAGYIKVFEYRGQKWAACPPVWNQSMYDPTQVREDLKINARPIPMLSKFWNPVTSDSVQPYNGSWLQRPIIKDGDDYSPILRKPDAIIVSMKVVVVNNNSTDVTLTIFNKGSASIASNAHIAFYDGGTTGSIKGIGSGAVHKITKEVGEDIFADKTVTRVYNLTGDWTNHLVWARIMDNAGVFIENGFTDCDSSNNLMGGAYCPAFIYTAQAERPSLCSPLDRIKLSATTTVAQNDTVFQWYRNNVKISGANKSYYYASTTGSYTCYITDGICRDYSSEVVIDFYEPAATHDYANTQKDTPVKIDVLSNDPMALNCHPTLAAVATTAAGGTTTAVNDSILYIPPTGFTGLDSATYTINANNMQATGKIYIFVPEQSARNYVACPGASITLSVGAIANVKYYWYATQNGGSPIASGSNVNSVTVVKNSSGTTESWWVEAQWQGKVFPRYRIDVKNGENCGSSTPTGCAADGSLVWKEDFGGNNSSDPDRAADPGWKAAGRTTYKYVSRTSSLLPDVGEYALLKGRNLGSTYWSHNPLDDHTSPNDNSTGYFLTFDANNNPGQFFEFNIDQLCSGMNLTFSAWLMNINPPSWNVSNYVTPKLAFVIEDMSGNVLSRFNTGPLQRTSNPSWLNYSFGFAVPAGISQVKVKFINNQNGITGTSGNDVSLDDIEVRLCAPPVNISQPATTDTTICEGSPITFNGKYDNSGGPFNNGSLTSKWLYSATGNINNPLEWAEVGSTAYGTGNITNTLSISSTTVANTGYYRMVVSDVANIGSWNCRALSPRLHLAVLPAMNAGVIGTAQTVCSGTAPNHLKFTTPASGGSSANYDYQWQFKANSAMVWSDILSATGTVYNPPVLTETTQYRVRVTDPNGVGNCKTVYTKEITVTVNPKPLIADKAITICSGASFSIIPNSGGGDIVPANTLYTWIFVDNTNITGESAQSIPQNAISNPPLTNTSVSVQTVQYNVTPQVTANGLSCVGNPFTLTVTVNPSSSLTLSSTHKIPSICSGDIVNYTATSATAGVTFKWIRQSNVNILEPPTTGNALINETLTNTGVDSTKVEYLFTLETQTGGCTNTETVTIWVYSKLNGGKTGTNQTVCHNTTPAALTLTGIAGGKTPYTHTWQYKTLGMSSWASIVGSNSTTYAPSAPLTETTLYRVETAGDKCGTALSDTVTVTVLPASMLVSPDVRIYACSGAGSINLSKFIDSTGLTALTWSKASSVSPSITVDGNIAGNTLTSGATYTYTYMISNNCISNYRSKVYLHVLTDNEAFNLRTDTVAVCYLYANNLQINRMFGLDDGGTIAYNPNPTGLGSVEPFMVKSIVPSKYAGALIFHGGDAYNAANILPSITYRGDASAKYMVFTYTASSTGCLKGKTYRIVVVLTAF